MRIFPTGIVNSTVARLATRYAGDYLEGIEPDKFDVAWRSGNLALNDVSVRRSVVDLFRLPFVLKYGKIGSVRIQLPLGNFFSLRASAQPVIVSLDELYIVVEPTSDWTDEKFEAQFMLSRQRLLDEAGVRLLAEQAKEELKKNAAAAASASKPGWLASFAARLVEDVQFEIRNVHIRVEQPRATATDRLSASSTGKFVFGFCLASLVISTPSKDAQKRLIQARDSQVATLRASCCPRDKGGTANLFIDKDRGEQFLDECDPDAGGNEGENVSGGEASNDGNLTSDVKLDEDAVSFSLVKQAKTLIIEGLGVYWQSNIGGVASSALPESVNQSASSDDLFIGSATDENSRRHAMAATVHDAAVISGARRQQPGNMYPPRHGGSTKTGLQRSSPTDSPRRDRSSSAPGATPMWLIEPISCTATVTSLTVNPSGVTRLKHRLRWGCLPGLGRDGKPSEHRRENDFYEVFGGGVNGAPEAESGGSSGTSPSDSPSRFLAQERRRGNGSAVIASLRDDLTINTQLLHQLSLKPECLLEVVPRRNSLSGQAAVPWATLYTLSCDVADVRVSVNEHLTVEAASVAKLLDAFAARGRLASQRLEFCKPYRPQVPVSGNAAIWWRYAFGCIVRKLRADAPGKFLLRNSPTVVDVLGDALRRARLEQWKREYAELLVEEWRLTAQLPNAAAAAALNDEGFRRRMDAVQQQLPTQALLDVYVRTKRRLMGLRSLDGESLLDEKASIDGGGSFYDCADNEGDEEEGTGSSARGNADSVVSGADGGVVGANSGVGGADGGVGGADSGVNSASVAKVDRRTDEARRSVSGDLSLLPPTSAAPEEDFNFDVAPTSMIDVEIVLALKSASFALHIDGRGSYLQGDVQAVLFGARRDGSGLKGVTVRGAIQALHLSFFDASGGRADVVSPDSSAGGEAPLPQRDSKGEVASLPLLLKLHLATHDSVADGPVVLAQLEKLTVTYLRDVIYSTWVSVLKFQSALTGGGEAEETFGGNREGAGQAPAAAASPLGSAPQRPSPQSSAELAAATSFAAVTGATAGGGEAAAPAPPLKTGSSTAAASSALATAAYFVDVSIAAPRLIIPLGKGSAGAGAYSNDGALEANFGELRVCTDVLKLPRHGSLCVSGTAAHAADLVVRGQAFYAVFDNVIVSARGGYGVERVADISLKGLFALASIVDGRSEAPSNESLALGGAGSSADGENSEIDGASGRNNGEVYGNALGSDDKSVGAAARNSTSRSATSVICTVTRANFALSKTSFARLMHAIELVSASASELGSAGAPAAAPAPAPAPPVAGSRRSDVRKRELFLDVVGRALTEIRFTEDADIWPAPVLCRFFVENVNAILHTGENSSSSKGFGSGTSLRLRTGLLRVMARVRPGITQLSFAMEELELLRDDLGAESESNYPGSVDWRLRSLLATPSEPGKASKRPEGDEQGEVSNAMKETRLRTPHFEETSSPFASPRQVPLDDDRLEGPLNGEALAPRMRSLERLMDENEVFVKIEVTMLAAAVGEVLGNREGRPALEVNVRVSRPLEMTFHAPSIQAFMAFWTLEKESSGSFGGRRIHATKGTGEVTCVATAGELAGASEVAASKGGDAEETAKENDIVQWKMQLEVLAVRVFCAATMGTNGGGAMPVSRVFAEMEFREATLRVSFRTYGIDVYFGMRALALMDIEQRRNKDESVALLSGELEEREADPERPQLIELNCAVVRKSSPFFDGYSLRVDSHVGPLQINLYLAKLLRLSQWVIDVLLGTFSGTSPLSEKAAAGAGVAHAPKTGVAVAGKPQEIELGHAIESCRFANAGTRLLANLWRVAAGCPPALMVPPGFLTAADGGDSERRLSAKLFSADDVPISLKQIAVSMKRLVIKVPANPECSRSVEMEVDGGIQLQNRLGLNASHYGLLEVYTLNISNVGVREGRGDGDRGGGGSNGGTDARYFVRGLNLTAQFLRPLVDTDPPASTWLRASLRADHPWLLTPYRIGLLMEVITKGLTTSTGEEMVVEPFGHEGIVDAYAESAAKTSISEAAAEQSARTNAASDDDDDADERVEAGLAGSFAAKLLFGDVGKDRSSGVVRKGGARTSLLVQFRIPGMTGFLSDDESRAAPRFAPFFFRANSVQVEVNRSTSEILSVFAVADELRLIECAQPAAESNVLLSAARRGLGDVFLKEMGELERIVAGRVEIPKEVVIYRKTVEKGERDPEKGAPFVFPTLVDGGSRPHKKGGVAGDAFWEEPGVWGIGGLISASKSDLSGVVASDLRSVEDVLRGINLDTADFAVLLTSRAPVKRVLVRINDPRIVLTEGFLGRFLVCGDALNQEVQKSVEDRPKLEEFGGLSFETDSSAKAKLHRLRLRSMLGASSVTRVGVALVNAGVLLPVANGGGRGDGRHERQHGFVALRGSYQLGYTSGQRPAEVKARDERTQLPVPAVLPRGARAQLAHPGRAIKPQVLRMKDGPQRATHALKNSALSVSIHDAEVFACSLDSVTAVDAWSVELKRGAREDSLVEKEFGGAEIPFYCTGKGFLIEGAPLPSGGEGGASAGRASQGSGQASPLALGRVGPASTRSQAQPAVITAPAGPASRLSDFPSRRQPLPQPVPQPVPSSFPEVRGATGLTGLLGSSNRKISQLLTEWRARHFPSVDSGAASELAVYDLIQGHTRLFCPGLNCKLGLEREDLLTLPDDASGGEALVLDPAAEHAQEFSAFVEDIELQLSAVDVGSLKRIVERTFLQRDSATGEVMAGAQGSQEAAGREARVVKAAAAAAATAAEEVAGSTAAAEVAADGSTAQSYAASPRVIRTISACVGGMRVLLVDDSEGILQNVPLLRVSTESASLRFTDYDRRPGEGKAEKVLLSDVNLEVRLAVAAYNARALAFEPFLESSSFTVRRSLFAEKAFSEEKGRKAEDSAGSKGKDFPYRLYQQWFVQGREPVTANVCATYLTSTLLRAARSLPGRFAAGAREGRCHTEAFRFSPYVVENNCGHHLVLRLGGGGRAEGGGQVWREVLPPETRRGLWSLGLEDDNGRGPRETTEQPKNMSQSKMLSQSKSLLPASGAKRALAANAGGFALVKDLCVSVLLERRKGSQPPTELNLDTVIRTDRAAVYRGRLAATEDGEEGGGEKNGPGSAEAAAESEIVPTSLLDGRPLFCVARVEAGQKRLSIESEVVVLNELRTPGLALEIRVGAGEGGLVLRAASGGGRCYVPAASCRGAKLFFRPARVDGEGKRLPGAVDFGWTEVGVDLAAAWRYASVIRWEELRERRRAAAAAAAAGAGAASPPAPSPHWFRSGCPRRIPPQPLRCAAGLPAGVDGNLKDFFHFALNIDYIDMQPGGVGKAVPRHVGAAGAAGRRHLAAPGGVSRAESAETHYDLRDECVAQLTLCLTPPFVLRSCLPMAVGYELKCEGGAGGANSPAAPGGSAGGAGGGLAGFTAAHSGSTTRLKGELQPLQELALFCAPLARRVSMRLSPAAGSEAAATRSSSQGAAGMAGAAGKAGAAGILVSERRFLPPLDVVPEFREACVALRRSGEALRAKLQNVLAARVYSEITLRRGPGEEMALLAAIEHIGLSGAVTIYAPVWLCSELPPELTRRLLLSRHAGGEGGRPLLGGIPFLNKIAEEGLGVEEGEKVQGSSGAASGETRPSKPGVRVAATGFIAPLESSVRSLIFVRETAFPGRGSNHAVVDSEVILCELLAGKAKSRVGQETPGAGAGGAREYRFLLTGARVAPAVQSALGVARAPALVAPLVYRVSDVGGAPKVVKLVTVSYDWALENKAAVSLVLLLGGQKVVVPSGGSVPLLIPAGGAAAVSLGTLSVLGALQFRLGVAAVALPSPEESKAGAGGRGASSHAASPLSALLTGVVTVESLLTKFEPPGTAVVATGGGGLFGLSVRRPPSSASSATSFVTVEWFLDEAAVKVGAEGMGGELVEQCSRHPGAIVLRNEVEWPLRVSQLRPPVEKGESGGAGSGGAGERGGATAAAAAVHVSHVPVWTVEPGATTVLGWYSTEFLQQLAVLPSHSLYRGCPAASVDLLRLRRGQKGYVRFANVGDAYSLFLRREEGGESEGQATRAFVFGRVGRVGSELRTRVVVAATPPRMFHGDAVARGLATVHRRGVAPATVTAASGNPSGILATPGKEADESAAAWALGSFIDEVQSSTPTAALMQRQSMSSVGAGGRPPRAPGAPYPRAVTDVVVSLRNGIVVSLITELDPGEEGCEEEEEGREEEAAAAAAGAGRLTRRNSTELERRGAEAAVSTAVRTEFVALTTGAIQLRLALETAEKAEGEPGGAGENSSKKISFASAGKNYLLLLLTVQWLQLDYLRPQTAFPVIMERLADSESTTTRRGEWSKVQRGVPVDIDFDSQPSVDLMLKIPWRTPTSTQAAVRRHIEICRLLLMPLALRSDLNFVLDAWAVANDFAEALGKSGADEAGVTQKQLPPPPAPPVEVRRRSSPLSVFTYDVLRRAEGGGRAEERPEFQLQILPYDAAYEWGVEVSDNGAASPSAGALVVERADFSRRIGLPFPGAGDLKDEMGSRDEASAGEGGARASGSSSFAFDKQKLGDAEYREQVMLECLLHRVAGRKEGNLSSIVLEARQRAQAELLWYVGADVGFRRRKVYNPLLRHPVGSAQVEKGENGETEEGGRDGTSNASRVYLFVDDFIISGLSCRVSFSPACTQVIPFLGTGFREQVLRLLLTLGTVQDAALAMSSVRFTDAVAADVAAFVARLYAAYFPEIRQQAILVAGNADVLGNPVEAFYSLGAGFGDLVLDPIEGFKDAALLQGVGKGVSSLVGHTLHGTLNAVSKVSRTMAQGLNFLTLDTAYAKRRQQALVRASTPRDFGEGLSKGAKALGEGLLGGFTTLISEPTKGIAAAVSGEPSNALSSVVGGFGKGMLGAILRPTAGALEAASLTASGLQSASSGQPRARNVQRRHLRVFWGRERRYEEYRADLAILNEQLFYVEGLHWQMLRPERIFVDRANGPGPGVVYGITEDEFFVCVPDVDGRSETTAPLLLVFCAMLDEINLCVAVAGAGPRRGVASPGGGAIILRYRGSESKQLNTTSLQFAKTVADAVRDLAPRQQP